MSDKKSRAQMVRDGELSIGELTLAEIENFGRDQYITPEMINVLTQPMVVPASEMARVTAERDALQQRLNVVEEENDQFRIALNIRRINRPDPPKIKSVDCEDCGDTGIEPCSRCAK